MELKFPIEKTIKDRISIRTYEEKAISENTKKQINEYIKTLKNPFGIDVSFQLIETQKAVNNEKLGTYGMIKGAKDFIGASVEDKELSLEALGYSFEELILYITSLGLGTCWLGGTFNRSGFISAMNIKENDLFPAITPIGYPVGKRRVTESLVRWAAKADQRKEWKTLFFKQDFLTPLSQEEAGEYAYPLEMLRLAPSAANKQPWRIAYANNAYHFYEERTLSENKTGIDIQKVDVGIGACHFQLAAQEKGLSGNFVKLSNVDIQTKDNVHYLFSWVVNQ